jgi:tRNA (guanine-N7-)-methyltransferase
MLQVFEGSGQFRNQSAPGGFSIRPETRPETKFETRGQRLGHGVWDVLLEKI